jgi:hypothetical protein
MALRIVLREATALRFATKVLSITEEMEIRVPSPFRERDRVRALSIAMMIG